VLLVLALPLLLQIAGTLFHAVKDWTLSGFRDFVRSGWITAAQAVINGVALLFQSYLSMDAIGRTLTRLGVTRQRLLEWETAASADRRLGAGLQSFIKTMWPAMALSIVLAVLLLMVRPESLPAAGGFLLAWFLSPVIAWWVSQDRQVREKPLNDEERRELG